MLEARLLPTRRGPAVECLDATLALARPSALLIRSTNQPQPSRLISASQKENDIVRGDHLVKRNQFDTCDGLLRAISFALLASAMHIYLGVHDDQSSTTIASEIKSSGIKAFQGGLHLCKRRVVGGALIGNHQHTALVHHP